MRRLALPIVLVGCVLLAGCLGQYATPPGATPSTGPSTDATTSVSVEAGDRELVTVDSPGCGESFEREPPTDPTVEAATEFAIACETSRVVSPEGYAHREAVVLGSTDGAVYVRATVLVGTETGRTHGVYRVGDGSFRRVQARGRPVDDYFYSDDHRENAAIDALLLNFGDRDRTLRLTLSYLNASPAKTVFDRPYALASGAGVEIRPVTMRVGTYEATVSETGEELASWRFELTEERAGDVVVVIVPDGDVEVFRAAENVVG